MLPIGTRYCRCPSCGAYFGGEKTFERHRLGDMSERRCLGPDDMRAEGLSQDARGYWRREYGVIAA
jgi:hypothetical protein